VPAVTGTVCCLLTQRHVNWFDVLVCAQAGLVTVQGQLYVASA
jgi:hypothetical protein